MVIRDVFSDISPAQVLHVEVTQPKRTRDLLQLVQTKGLGENVSILLIRWNIVKFDFTVEDRLTDKMVVHSMRLVWAWNMGFFASWMLLRL